MPEYVSSDKSKLGELFNDDSFIYWIKQDARLSYSMKKKWDGWLASDERNKHLFEKAKKIIEMPFKEVEQGCDSEELFRLKKTIKKTDKTKSG